MQCIQAISGLILRRLFGSVSHAGEGAGGLQSHQDLLATAGHHLSRALRQANAGAWFAIEILLAGEPLWEQAQLDWKRELEEEFFQPLRGLLDSSSLEPVKTMGADSRLQALGFLRRAVGTRLLTSGSLEPKELLPSSNALADQNSRQAEWNCLQMLAVEAERTGNAELRDLFRIRWRSGDSFLVLLASALFRKAVQADQDLFGDLAVCLFKDDGHKRPGDIDQLATLVHVHRTRLEALLEQVCSQTVSQNAPSSAVELGVVNLQKGEAFAQRGDHESAIVEFTSALGFNPTLIKALVLRGDSHRLRGENDLALADYTQALQSDSSNIVALSNRSQILSFFGKQDEAIADCTAILQIDPNNSLAYHNRGKANSRAERFEAALLDFSKAVRLDPNNGWAFHDRGDAYAALGDHERAIADYSSALRLNPRAALTYVRRAEVYRQTGQPDRAIADYSDALRLDPLNVSACAQRGVAYRERGDLDQAIADLTRTLELDPANAELFRQRGMVFQLRSEHAKALADFDSALRFQGGNADLHYHRALAHAALKSPEKALDDLNQALGLNPNYAAAYDRRGQLFADQGKTTHALADFSAALRIDPGLTLAYVHRAKVLARADCLDDALADCELALGQDPKCPAAYYVRGSTLWQRGNFETALKDFSQTIALEPGNAEAFHRRGLTHAKLGDPEEALADLTESLRLDPTSAEAYSNRARVYEKTQDHEQSLNDFAHAVRLDARYAAAYCNQRGLLHASNGWYDRAAADFSVALLLDPANEPARSGRVWALRKLESRPQFWAAHEENGRTRIREVRAGDLSPDKSGSINSVRLKAASRVRAAAPTGQYRVDRSTARQTAVIGLGQSSKRKVTTYSAEVAVPIKDAGYDEPVELTEDDVVQGEDSPLNSPEKTITVTKDDTEEYYREQRLEAARKKAEEDFKLRVAAQENIERQRKAEAVARQTKKHRRSTDDDDDDDGDGIFVRWRKALIAMAALVLLAILAPFGMGWFKAHRKIDPPLQAKTVWENYNNDPQAANQKYANQRFFIIGKLTITQAAPMSPRQVFFQAPVDAKILIKCTFSAVNELAEVPSGSPPGSYLISGEFQPYSEGALVELTNCEFIGASNEPAPPASGSVGLWDKFATCRIVNGKFQTCPTADPAAIPPGHQPWLTCLLSDSFSPKTLRLHEMHTEEKLNHVLNDSPAG
jgi:tetratricopeptide (TPR) repeat protein